MYTVLITEDLFLGDEIEFDVNEPVEEDKEDIRQEEFSLPPGFEWKTLDLKNEKEVCVPLP